MTNGNDIIEYEESNVERLQEDWCKRLGVDIDMLDNEEWFKKNIQESQSYWDYVSECQSEDGCDREPDDNWLYE